MRARKEARILKRYMQAPMEQDADEIPVRVQRSLGCLCKRLRKYYKRLMKKYGKDGNQMMYAYYRHLAARWDIYDAVFELWNINVAE